MARGRRVHWTPEMNATLERMLAEGRTTAEMACALNLPASGSTTYRWRNLAQPYQPQPNTGRTA